MQHPDEGQIHAWLDGELSAEDVTALEAHISECAECSAKVAEARGLIAASSRIVSALDIVPAGVIPMAKPQVKRPWYTDAQFGAAAAAVVVVAAASLLLLKRGVYEQAARTAMVAADTPALASAPRSPLPAPVASVPEHRSYASARRDARAPIIAQKKTSPKASAERMQASSDALSEITKPTAQTRAPEKALEEPAKIVVAGATAMADAALPALTLVKADTSVISVRNVYEVSPNVQVTLVETPLESRNFAATTAAKAQRARVESPSPAPTAPPATSRAMMKTIGINTITWVKGARLMTLSGVMTVEELTALRLRLPEDKR